MTMKSVYIVYITNCFLWTMSDNKTHRIVSYRISHSYFIKGTGDCVKVHMH